MKNFAYILLACLALYSCTRDAKSSEKQGDFYLELILEKDGCKLYRLRDAGYYIYWSTCEGQTIYTKSHSTGKSNYTNKVQCITSVKRGVDKDSLKITK